MSNAIVEFAKEEQRPAPVEGAPPLPLPPSVITVATTPPPANWQPPVFGGLAVIFGVTALFKAAVVLGPLALLCALLALIRRQYAWAAVGAGAALGALLTSPTFWTLLGLAWLLKRVL
jgi:hypothetical protein